MQKFATKYHQTICNSILKGLYNTTKGDFSQVQEWLVQHKKISVTHHINTAKGKTTTIISV